MNILHTIKIAGLICLLGCPLGVSAQVPLINIDQLNKRVSDGKDTAFIIHFWATWCLPCVKELPYFEKLHRIYKADKLKILLISVDYKSKLKSTVGPFIKKRSIKNEVFLLNETDQQVYINRIDSNWSGGIPATLFIKNGNRKFMEQTFTYPQLLTAYKQLQL